MKKEELHARVLYLYQILCHYSDSEHPLTTQQILKIMDEEYHIQIHRVSVQTYVEILNSCGIKVNQQRSQDKYYYLDNRTFDIPELKLMIDALQTSCFIPEEKTNELISKLLTLTSDCNADRLRREVFGMHEAEEFVEVSLLYDGNLMEPAIEQFKADADTELIDRGYFRAKVKIHPSLTFYKWVFGWGGKLRIESPPSIREEYRTLLKEALKEV